MQRREGADVVALTPDEAKARFPWLNVEDIEIATTALDKALESYKGAPPA